MKLILIFPSSDLKCDVFKEDILSIPEMLKKYPPPNPGNFAGSKTPDVVDLRSTMRIMNNDMTRKVKGFQVAPMRMLYLVKKHALGEDLKMKTWFSHEHITDNTCEELLKLRTGLLFSMYGTVSEPVSSTILKCQIFEPMIIQLTVMVRDAFYQNHV